MQTVEMQKNVEPNAVCPSASAAVEPATRCPTVQAAYYSASTGQKPRWTRWRGKSGNIYELQILANPAAGIGISGVIIVGQRGLKGWTALWIGNAQALRGVCDLNVLSGILDSYPNSEILIGSDYPKEGWEAICLDLISEHKPELNLGALTAPPRIWDNADCQAMSADFLPRPDRTLAEAVRIGDTVTQMWERLCAREATSQAWQGDAPGAVQEHARAAPALHSQTQVRIMNEISLENIADRVTPSPVMTKTVWRCHAQEVVTGCVATTSLRAIEQT